MRRRRRLIPARAGKTDRPCRSGRTAPAHPRAGGENEIARAEDVNANGSSPRGRGKRRRRRVLGFLSRLIPARAGKTTSPDPNSDAIWAHPRAGGENSINRSHTGARGGSSPRGRGKHNDVTPGGLHLGLIPARAGKTRRGGLHLRGAGAHPRAGGENRVARIRPRWWVGSSPRGRGKPADRALSGKWSGLIPARAGKTRANGWNC